MLTYPEYKNSGIAWIGDIPIDWSIIPAKQVFTEIRDKNSDGHETNALQFKFGEIISKKNFDASTDGYVSDTIATYTIVEPNTIMINGLNLNYDLKSLRVAIVKDRGVITSAYLALKPNESKIVPQFANYLLKGYETRMAFHNMGSGVRLTLGFKEFKNQPIVLPKLNVQETIVTYLNKKSKEIDSLISEAKASIEEYKQWKASIIQEAVTKGLDSDAELVDSGVGWIGTIPRHWKMSRIKNETINLDSLREPISAENRENELGLYDYYGASGAIDKIDDFNVDDTVLLIGEDGANLKMRNLPLVYRASGKFWVNNHAHILKVNEENNYGYMAYLLEAGDYAEYITGAAQPKLSQFNLMRFPIPIAPREEQDAIEAYLDVKVKNIEFLISEKESLIEDLEAFKRALIFEVVTGKRKVV